MAEDNAVVIPEDVSSYWKSLDPAVRAALMPPPLLLLTLRHPTALLPLLVPKDNQ